jgi:hypothetical protein
MPRTTPTFHPVRGIHRWSSRQGSENLAEEAICPTRCEVGEAVLPSVWLCQRSYEHSHRTSHSPLLTRLSNPNWSDEPSSTVGGQRTPQPFPPLRPAHVALALCFLAKTLQMHFAIFQSPMTMTPSVRKQQVRKGVVSCLLVPRQVRLSPSAHVGLKACCRR